MKDLPVSSVDVILLALDDHEMLQQERTKPWHRAGIAWARSPGSGAAPPVVIAIDPLSPHQGFKPELSTKVKLFSITRSVVLYYNYILIRYSRKQ